MCLFFRFVFSDCSWTKRLFGLYCCLPLTSRLLFGTGLSIRTLRTCGSRPTYFWASSANAVLFLIISPNVTTPGEHGEQVWVESGAISFRHSHLQLSVISFCTSITCFSAIQRGPACKLRRRSLVQWRDAWLFLSLICKNRCLEGPYAFAHQLINVNWCANQLINQYIYIHIFVYMTFFLFYYVVIPNLVTLYIYI